MAGTNTCPSFVSNRQESFLRHKHMLFFGHLLKRQVNSLFKLVVQGGQIVSQTTILTRHNIINFKVPKEQIVLLANNSICILIRRFKYSKISIYDLFKITWGTWAGPLIKLGISPHVSHGTLHEYNFCLSWSEGLFVLTCDNKAHHWDTEKGQNTLVSCIMSPSFIQIPPVYVRPI